MVRVTTYNIVANFHKFVCGAVSNRPFPLYIGNYIYEYHESNYKNILLLTLFNMFLMMKKQNKTKQKQNLFYVFLNEIFYCLSDSENNKGVCRGGKSDTLYRLIRNFIFYLYFINIPTLKDVRTYCSVHLFAQIACCLPFYQT